MDSAIARSAMYCDGRSCTDHRIEKSEVYSSDGQFNFCPSCAEAPIIEALARAGSLA
jgi:hypothetical protein